MVGIAVGTVLLPEMSRRLAAGDEKGAASAQARGIQLALLLTIPCAAGAIVIPDLIMRALFARGAFTAADAAAAGATLAAYSIGLLALRAAQELHRALLCPRRYRHAGQGGAARRRHQHPA